MPLVAQSLAALMLLAAAPVAADRDAKRVGKVIGTEAAGEHVAGTADGNSDDIAKSIEERVLQAQRTAHNLANSFHKALASELEIDATLDTQSKSRHGDKKALLWDNDGYCCSKVSISEVEDTDWCYMKREIGDCNDFGFPRSLRKLDGLGNSAEKKLEEKVKALCDAGSSRKMCEVQKATPASFKLDNSTTNCICMERLGEKVADDSKKLKISEFDFPTYLSCLGVTKRVEDSIYTLSVEPGKSCAAKCGNVGKVVIADVNFDDHHASSCSKPASEADMDKSPTKCLCADLGTAANISKEAVPFLDVLDPKETELETAQLLASCYRSCPLLCKAKQYERGFCAVPRSAVSGGGDDDNAAAGLSVALALHLSIWAVLGAWFRT